MNVQRAAILCGYCVFLSISAKAITVPASIEVQCSGQASDAATALRWASPDYNSSDGDPTKSVIQPVIFKVPCNGQVRSTTATLVQRDSEFEVQTEGGIRTSYTIRITLQGPPPNANGFIELSHSGSPAVTTRGSGFTLNRSSGPNKYGEQNFRVILPPGSSPNVRVLAQSAGDRNDAQMALRWGHNDFNENEFFPLWTIKAGAAQVRQFRLTSPKSEFEIQTEGGEGTSYHLSVWFDLGQGFPMQPSIEIVHKLTGTTLLRGMDNVRFQPGNDNAYGEMNTRVFVPALPVTVMSPSMGGSMSTRMFPGTGSINFIYNFGIVEITTSPPAPLNAVYSGNWISGSGTMVNGARTAFKEQDIPRTLTIGPNNRFPGPSETNLQPGDWNISVGPQNDPTACTIKVLPDFVATITVDRTTRKCMQ